MLTITYILSALSLFTVTSSTPLEQHGIRISLSNRDGTQSEVVDYSILSDRQQYIRDKYDAGFVNYENNTGERHPLSQSEAGYGSSGSNDGMVQKRTNGLEPLTRSSTKAGNSWEGTIAVGTPPQTFTVQFDTACADFILPGVSCSSAACEGHSQYDPSASTTITNLNKKFQLPRGHTQGSQYKDNVEITAFTATNQVFGAASSYSDYFNKSIFPSDGQLGMAYQNISAINARPVFQTLLANKQITNPVFAIKLSHANSELRLGGVDQSLYTGTFTYVPVKEQGFWQVKMDAVGFNGKTIHSITPVQAVVDTGVSFLMTSQSQAELLYKSIPGSKDASDTVGQGFFTFPCASNPTISLTFGGKSFSVDPSLFNLGKASADSTDCVGAVTGGLGYNFWVVGDTFLQNVYTSFDFGNNRVGFATLS